MKTTPAHIVREYGPFDDTPAVHGVSFDGKQLWFASGDHVNAVDPDSGRLRRARESLRRELEAALHATGGTR